MNKERHSSRFNSYAKILMDGIPGYMRDISTEGFKYVTMLPFASETGEIKHITVIPQDPLFPPFEMEGEIRWANNDGEGFQTCGIQIVRFKNSEGERIYKEMENQFSA